MNLRKILAFIAKNVLYFLAGSILGILILFIFLLKPLLAGAGADVGLAIIALAPILILFYSILTLILGGILGVIIMNLVMLFIKKKK
ncbi:hypothetical protein JXC34_05440 [Candidatus Woesearchaeota archaeon]|nr:hypothetical protein [Candidatus Woesearchaeota archaeon]